MTIPREPSANSDAKAQSLPARILSLIFLLLPPVLLVYFLFSPFPNTETPRLTLLLQPLNDPEFVNTIWFGQNLPDAPVTGERFLTTALGFFVVFAAFCWGRLLLAPLTKIIEPNKRETIFFSTTLGLIFFASIFLYSGLLGLANLPYFTSALCVAGIALFFWKRKRANTTNAPKEQIKRKFSFSLFCQIVLAILFTAFYVLGSSTPLFEYDAVEYHAQSAREIFESGKIAFFDHNVYANMPLGAETFYLAGFNSVRDLGFDADNILRLGSLVGKTILASFALLTALGIWSSGKRFFSRNDAGIWGAILFLSFPGVFEVYSNGLNDGVLGAALFAAFYLFLLGFTENKRFLYERRALFLWASGMGVFAGFACAVKYTSVVFVLIPIFLELCAIFWAPRLAFLFPKVKNQDADVSQPETRALSTQTRVLALALFLATSCVVCGGWYIRNAVASGNPVYPLAYSVFGDKTGEWNESIQQRWSHAHSSSDFSPKALGDACFASALNDTTSSPFFLWFVCFGAAFFSSLALAPRQSGDSTSRAILFDREKSATYGVFILVALFWFAWFLLTHRLVRFLIPITPLVATILGLFVAKGVSGGSRAFQGVFRFSVLVGLLFSGLLIDLLGVGRMAPLRALERDPLRLPQAAIYFNDRPELFNSQNSEGVDAQQKLLLVGEAKAFVYRVPVLYSTCWNNSPLIPLLEGNVERNAQEQIVRVTNAAQIVANLKEAQIAYVLVDFYELERFRSPGNYGFNNAEISENLFELLVKSNVLEPFAPAELQNVGEKIKIYKVCSPGR